MKPAVLLFMGLTVFFNSSAHIVLKYNAQSSHEVLSHNLNPFVKPEVTILFILGAGCFAISIFFYQEVLASSDLSIAYSVLTSLNYVIIILYSFFVFREKLTLMQGAGLVLIIAGLFLLLYNYSPPAEVNTKNDPGKNINPEMKTDNPE